MLAEWRIEWQSDDQGKPFIPCTYREELREPSFEQVSKAVARDVQELGLRWSAASSRWSTENSIQNVAGLLVVLPIF